MALDFATARMKHGLWKTRLREFLDGKGTLTAAQATSHKDCDLGKWMYSEGLKNYGTILEMQTLEKVHAELHATIKKIVALKDAGKAKEAEIEFQKVEPISKRIVDLLNAVEAKVEKKAA